MKITLHIAHDGHGNLGAFFYINEHPFSGALHASTVEGLLRELANRPEIKGAEAMVDIVVHKDIGL